jgi:hypothetical protein
MIPKGADRHPEKIISQCKISDSPAPAPMAILTAAASLGDAGRA